MGGRVTYVGVWPGSFKTVPMAGYRGDDARAGKAEKPPNALQQRSSHPPPTMSRTARERPGAPAKRWELASLMRSDQPF